MHHYHSAGVSLQLCVGIGTNPPVYHYYSAWVSRVLQRCIGTSSRAYHYHSPGVSVLVRWCITTAPRGSSTIPLVYHYHSAWVARVLRRCITSTPRGYHAWFQKIFAWCSGVPQLIPRIFIKYIGTKVSLKQFFDQIKCVCIPVKC